MKFGSKSRLDRALRLKVSIIKPEHMGTLTILYKDVINFKDFRRYKLAEHIIQHIKDQMQRKVIIRTVKDVFFDYIFQNG